MRTQNVTLLVLAWSAAVTAALSTATTAADLPSDDPAAGYKLSWTGKLPWANVLDVTAQPGADIEAKLAAAQRAVQARGGGVVFFPAGTYTFREDIKLGHRVVLRGAAPSVADARAEGFDPPTRFEFPKYQPSFTGEGTPTATAFKGIVLADPARDSDCGLVHIAINRGHVLFEHVPVLADDGKTPKDFAAGSNRIVFGCKLTNTAFADPAVPDRALGQHAWQRYTWRFGSAIDIRVRENGLVANNRIPKSGDDNFTFPEYVIAGRKKGEVVKLADKVVFDYDNRPGIAVNDYGIGGQGGAGPDGTPDSHPWGFRLGIDIRENYVYCSGRCAITFTADGAYVGHNVIRFPESVTRYTTTGRNGVGGSATNDNRAVQMRGWRWTVEHNDYIVHRNRAGDTGYLINDGEGLMHEDHVNAIVRDSKLIANKGNTYISIYKTAGIDGLLVKDNDIRLNDGKQTIASGAAIYVVANRNSGAYPCRNVQILNNTTAGGGISIAGEPAEGNVVRGNRNVGATAKLQNGARAELADNVGYDVSETRFELRKK